MTKVLLGLGLLLVVTVAMVAGTVIYATWFDSPDEDMPTIIQEDVMALAKTHAIIRAAPRSYEVLACPPHSPSSPRYIGVGIWIVTFGECFFRVNDRTGEVGP